MAGFANAAEGHAELAVTAVDTMVSENTSPGLTAFAEYWEKVAGESGYLANSRIVATAIAVAFFQAAMLVLTGQDRIGMSSNSAPTLDVAALMTARRLNARSGENSGRASMSPWTPVDCHERISTI